MIYVISGVLAFLGMISLYISSLRTRAQNAEQDAAQAKAKALIQTDMEKIAEKAKVSDEKVIDFNDAVDKFNNNNK